MTELNLKLTKQTHDTGRLPIYVRTSGLKRGEGVCSKGAYFRELTIIITELPAVVSWLAVDISHANR